MNQAMTLIEARPRIGRTQLPPLPIAALWLAVVLANAWFLAWTLAEMLLTDSSADWSIFVQSAHLAGRPELYAFAGPGTFPYSPLMAWVFILVTAMGLIAWRLLHIAAALALPTWRMRLLVLASWPFWVDFSLGNFLTFAFVLAVWAMRGNRFAIGGTLLVAIVVPRPLMIPIVLWLLWQNPSWRWPFAVAFVVHLGLVALTGLADEWIRGMSALGPAMLPWLFNVGPSRVIGLWWLVIGIPLAAWLLLRGRVGFSALAISPYLNPYYLLFALLPSGSRRSG